MPLPLRDFGETGLRVSALGLGAGRIGEDAIDDAQAEALLRQTVELGVCLVDTARSYGSSEARIGRWIGPVRDQVVLSTKLGYGIDGVEDWTAACVTAGVDEARDRLRTDVLDIVHLHSCPADVLARGEVVDALDRARKAGKIRVVAYSGENEALYTATGDARIGAIQTSVNLCDPASSRGTIAQASARGIGVIAKRPLANAFWRFESRPDREDIAVYWERGRALGVTELAATAGLSVDELCLRYAAHAPGVHAAIVGTGDATHLRRAVEIVERGPLPAEVLEAVHAAQFRVGAQWPGLI